MRTYYIYSEGLLTGCEYVDEIFTPSIDIYEIFSLGQIIGDSCDDGIGELRAIHKIELIK